VVELVERLLAHGPGVVVLATSRARLLLPFERVFPVGGLSVDDAVELSMERAAAAGVPLTAADRARVGRICRGLGGVPLAIELAAAAGAGPRRARGWPRRPAPVAHRLAREAAAAATGRSEQKGPRLLHLLRPAPRYI
jgi:hypothetical protein